MSLAEGLTDIAAENNVVVFRRVNGKRMVARFDVEAIRGGSSEDPEILGDDVVVVD